MRKNRMMRLASALLILTMVTTCAISGTFAKYVTSDSATDSARVAKWGVGVEVTGENAFLLTYDTDDDSCSSTIEKSVTTSSAGDDPIIAPGTKGTLGTVTITGSPEVAVNVKKDATLELTGWKVGSDEYCPIIFTVGTTEYKIGDTGIATIADLIAKVEAAVECDNNYAPNTELANTDDVTVKWAWPFYVSADNDVKDTALGDADTAATISFSCTTTVTQID